MTEQLFRAILRGYRSQFSSDTLEELIDHHAGGAADHALAEAGDGTAGAHVARVFKQSAGIVRRELNGSFAFYEARRAAAIHAHFVFGSGLEIVQADRAAENAADRAYTESHLQVVSAFAGLLEFLATGKALGNPIRVC